MATTSAAEPAPSPYTLRFYEWRAGHHGQRPADIPVQSVEQAALILQAIGNAISQPGHARAALFDADSGTTIYLTDDYAEPIAKGWPSRTIVYHGTEAEVAEALGLQDAFDYAYGGELQQWDGKSWLDDMGLEVMVTLTPEEVAAAVAPVSWCEEGQRQPVCDVPPVVKPLAELLAELRETKAEMDAYAAETAQDQAAP